MAIPNTNITKTLTLASDGKKYTKYPDGVLPGSAPGALTMDTPTKTSTSITGVVIDGNGSTSYQVSTDSGSTWSSGLTKSGLTAETLYPTSWRGVNEFGTGPATTPVNVTTNAGSTSALSWSAPSGLADQNELILTTDTHTFLSPEKSAWIGFGEGWLYQQADGTAMAQSITVGAETIDYEYGVGSEQRFVQTENGLKILRGTSYAGGTGVAGIGTIDWDTGSDITNASNIFTYSRVKCTDGTVANADFQWKQERVRDGKYLSGPDNNSVYVTETTPSGSGRRLIAYTGGGGAQALYGAVPKHGDGWFSFGWSWKPNTPDGADGKTGLFSLKDGDTGISINYAPTNSGGDLIDDIITSAAPERPRHVMVQDYIGNNTNSTDDIQISRTDIYWQRGGTLFFLADNSDPAFATKIVPLRVNSITGTDTASLRLWKGTMADYVSKSVLVYDSVLNFIDSVELV